MVRQDFLTRNFSAPQIMLAYHPCYSSVLISVSGKGASEAPFVQTQNFFTNAGSFSLAEILQAVPAEAAACYCLTGTTLWKNSIISTREIA